MCIFNKISDALSIFFINPSFFIICLFPIWINVYCFLSSKSFPIISNHRVMHFTMSCCGIGCLIEELFLDVSLIIVCKIISSIYCREKGINKVLFISLSFYLNLYWDDLNHNLFSCGRALRGILLYWNFYLKYSNLIL